MDKKILAEIQKDLNEAVKAVGEKHNFKPSGGSRITYSDTGFTFKTEVLFTTDDNGKEIAPEERTFNDNCKFFGLSPDDYLKEVRVHGDLKNTYRIIGISPKARKNSVIIEDVKTKKSYVCPPSSLDNLDGSILLRNFHRCGYCGEAVFSDNEDLLCDECRSMFGHTFYSEL